VNVNNTPPPPTLAHWPFEAKNRSEETAATPEPWTATEKTWFVSAESENPEKVPCIVNGVAKVANVPSGAKGIAIGDVVNVNCP